MWGIKLVKTTRKIITSQILIIRGGETIQISNGRDKAHKTTTQGKGTSQALGFGLQDQLAYDPQQATTQGKGTRQVQHTLGTSLESLIKEYMVKMMF